MLSRKSAVLSSNALINANDTKYRIVIKSKTSQCCKKPRLGTKFFALMYKDQANLYLTDL